MDGTTAERIRATRAVKRDGAGMLAEVSPGRQARDHPSMRSETAIALQWPRDLFHTDGSPETAREGAREAQ